MKKVFFVAALAGAAMLACAVVGLVGNVTANRMASRVARDTTQRLRSDLGLSEDKVTTDDFMFTLETVSCLGACSLAPVVMVNDTVHPTMTPDKVSALIRELREAK